jgi:hypothetical protein
MWAKVYYVAQIVGRTIVRGIRRYVFSSNLIVGQWDSHIVDRVTIDREEVTGSSCLFKDLDFKDELVVNTNYDWSVFLDCS